MTVENYYAKVKYRGAEKDYKVTAHENNDIRVIYLDYNPKRDSDGVWIKNGKDKIVTVYNNNSKEVKYYEALIKEWDSQIKIIEEKQKRIYNIKYASLGTDHYKEAFKKAVKLLKEGKEN